MGSGDAEDFFNDPAAGADDYSIPAEPKKDTGKAKLKTEIAPPTKPGTPAADDKNKKPATKPTEKPRPATNEY
jgi:hypothetical protein